MTSDQMLLLLGEMDDQLLLQEEKSCGKSSMLRTRISRVGVLAACLCLCIVAVVICWQLPSLGRQPDKDSQGDIVYACWFNGFLYEPISHVDLMVYPALEELRVGNIGQMLFDINEEDLGEKIGVFPAVEPLDWGEGIAYHLAAYPTYNSVIAVAWDGRYRIFVSEGNAIAEEFLGNSSDILSLHGMPDSVQFFTIGHVGLGGTKVSSADVIAELCSILSGKEPISVVELEKERLQLWNDTYGEGGVTWENGSLQYESAEIREEFVGFVNQGVVGLWFSTDQGFTDLLLSYDSALCNFCIAGRYFSLSEEEAARINDLLQNGGDKSSLTE